MLGRQRVAQPEGPKPAEDPASVSAGDEGGEAHRHGGLQPSGELKERLGGAATGVPAPVDRRHGLGAGQRGAECHLQSVGPRHRQCKVVQQVHWEERELSVAREGRRQYPLVQPLREHVAFRVARIAAVAPQIREEPVGRGRRLGEQRARQLGKLDEAVCCSAVGLAREREADGEAVLLQEADAEPGAPPREHVLLHGADPPLGVQQD
mmetsp:Transcript_12506/g.46268  ORF Transcript_12506/g.46268 Transcript_12506/m.46268 type:complete len:208 (+) Transcript_12506:2286-2909(+)